MKLQVSTRFVEATTAHAHPLPAGLCLVAHPHSVTCICKFIRAAHQYPVLASPATTRRYRINTHVHSRRYQYQEGEYVCVRSFIEGCMGVL